MILQLTAESTERMLPQQTGHVQHAIQFGITIGENLSLVSLLPTPMTGHIKYQDINIKISISKCQLQFLLVVW